MMKELPIGVVMVCARPKDALFKAQARDSVVLEEFDGEFHRVPESKSFVDFYKTFISVIC